VSRGSFWLKGGFESILEVKAPRSDFRGDEFRPLGLEREWVNFPSSPPFSGRGGVLLSVSSLLAISEQWAYLPLFPYVFRYLWLFDFVA